MDKSEEYCKMCNCSEIQDLWYPEVGDYFSHNIKHDAPAQWSIICDLKKRSKQGVLELEFEISHDIGGHDCFQTEEHLKAGWFIWIPRQDQLQAMVKSLIIENYGESISYLHRQFSEWLRGEDPEFETYEQLWLAYVMLELHNKKWNGEVWEK